MKESKRCSNTIKVTKFNHLYVGFSQLSNSGNALFAEITINKDEVIPLFIEEILADTQVKLRAKKGNDKYSLI